MIIPFAVTTVVLLVLNAQHAMRWILLAALIFMAVDLMLSGHEVHAEYNDAYRFQSEMCSNESQLIRHVALYNACKDSATFTSMPVSRRLQHRATEHFQDLYHSLVARWATDTYLQVAGLVIILYCLQLLLSFYNRRMEIQAQSTMQNKQLELHVQSLGHYQTLTQQLMSQRRLTSNAHSEIADAEPIVTEVDAT